MQITCIQLDPAAGAVSQNIARAESAVVEAANAGADLIVLPEQFAVGFFAFEEYDSSAQPIGGEIHNRFASLANDHGVAILVGSIVEDLAATREQTPLDTPASSGLANTSVLYDAAGTRRAVYRKTHLWGYDSEEATRLVPGETLGTATVQDMTMGIVTCYDLRFPSLFRALIERDVELILVPSAWPFPRVEHWRTLTKARAIENLAFVATANGTGRHGGEWLCGRSAIIDPWGTTLASGGDDPEIIHSTIDPTTVRSIRSEFPSLADRRPESTW